MGELTQADVDQANTNAEEAKKALEAANDELAAVQKQLTSAQELLQNCSDRKKAADEDYDEAVKKISSMVNRH